MQKQEEKRGRKKERKKEAKSTPFRNGKTDHLSKTILWPENGSRSPNQISKFLICGLQSLPLC